jgi:uncharacterized membrane protein
LTDKAVSQSAGQSASRAVTKPRGIGAPHSRAWTRGGVLVLSALIAAITSARLVGLDQLLVWHDEVYTLLRVFGYPAEQGWAVLFDGSIRTADQVLAFQRPDPERGFADTWRELTGHPEHAPLYYLLGWLATRLPLEPVVALRGTAALFGLLLPAAAFWLMHELFGRKAFTGEGPSPIHLPVPWVAALLIACSPLHLLYAQEARQYALWTLLILASSAALVRALRERRPRDWWLYAGLLTLGLYTHLLFALMLAVHAAYAWLAAAHASGQLLRPRGLALRPWLLAAGSALILFLPWILVFMLGLEQAMDYTGWMSRPAGAAANLLAWGQFLVRSLFDIWPDQPPAHALLLLLPLAAALGHYLRRAPRPACWLLPLIALAYAAVVLGPDLVLGGVRSIHGRYGLPALLAAQLMLAWTLGSLLQSRGAGRIVSAAALVMLVCLGLASQLRIGQAETWWTKNPNLSALTPRAAQTLNGQQQPFLAVGASGLALGQLLSVAHRLDDRVRVLGFRRQTPPSALPADLEQVLLLIPTQPLRAALGPGFFIQPWDDGETWALATATPERAIAE